jgi:hypothetical protein
MAKLTLEFSPDVINKTIEDFNIDLCVKVADGSTVSASGMGMTELGYGLYIVENEEVESDTVFRISLKSDPLVYTTATFSLSDDNIARQSTITEVSTVIDHILLHVDDLSVADLVAKLLSIRDMLLGQKNSVVLRPAANNIIGTCDDGLANAQTRIYIPVNSQNVNEDVISNNGKVVKYKDGSELIIKG